MKWTKNWCDYQNSNTIPFFAMNRETIKNEVTQLVDELLVADYRCARTANFSINVHFVSEKNEDSFCLRNALYREGYILLGQSILSFKKGTIPIKKWDSQNAFIKENRDAIESRLFDLLYAGVKDRSEKYPQICQLDD
ncbi:MAG: hypothetical protein LBN39_12550 [Planctomycetaceae bacterium]|jgi:hypothetical protein|nr:hypothetical protein [Planctomycetaceae bacterium]